MNYIFFTHDKFNDHFVKKAQPLLQKKRKNFPSEQKYV